MGKQGIEEELIYGLAQMIVAKKLKQKKDLDLSLRIK